MKSGALSLRTDYPTAFRHPERSFAVQEIKKRPLTGAWELCEESLVVSRIRIGLAKAILTRSI